MAALQVGERVVADAVVLVGVIALGSDGLDGGEEGLDMELDASLDDGADGPEEADKGRDLVFEVNNQFDAFDEDALDLGLFSLLDVSLLPTTAI